MKKILLFFILINLSLFAQSYINSLYDAIKENNTKKIIDIANNYKIDLNNVFFMPEDVYFSDGIEAIPVNISPLIYAIECTNIEAIDTLLKLGANLERLTDIYSYSSFLFLDAGHHQKVSITPLMYAAYSSTEEVISFLIKKGAKVNAKDREGRTALMYRLSEALIRAEADINAKDNYGKTALMYASRYYYEESVDLLIKNKANINAKDKDGYTVLMYACWGDWTGNFALLNPATVKLLVRAGANVNEVSKYGSTVLTFAISVYKSAASFNLELEEMNLTILHYQFLKL